MLLKFIKFLKFSFFIFTFFIIFFSFIGLGVYLHFARNLPKIIKISDYKPKLVSNVYDVSGIKIAEFYRERRELAKFDEIPTLIIKAFIASEDDKFFEHKGLDFKGILRAMVANFKTGRFGQGGSTITQQVARSLLLSSEKKLSRKIKEAILAGRIESKLSKEEILFLYLNQIYLGHGSYGVKAAARAYFDKDLQDINLAEAALLAGLPQAPSRWSPFTNPDMAKERQLYVLARMVEVGYISIEEAKKAANLKLKLYKSKELNKAPYFSELVRKHLVSKYGDDLILDAGLNIYTSLDYRMQKSAEESVSEKLKELDKRQGFNKPLMHLDSDEEISSFLDQVHKDLLKGEKEYINFPEPGYVFDIRSSFFSIENKNPEEVKEVITPIIPGSIYKAVVLNINNKNEVEIAIGTRTGIIDKSGYSWAYPRNLDPTRWSNRILKDIRDILKKGDVILAKAITEEYFSLDQEPEVEAALLSIDVNNGYVKAMVGGYDFKRSEFNRAYQAKRQAGSTFKPIVYAAALDKNYTAASIIVDSPIVQPFSSDEEGEERQWKPSNYSEKFYGDTTFCDALIFSRNIPTTKIAQDIGVNSIIEISRKLGISSDMEKDLSVALGSTAVSVWELTKAFSVFASGGKRVIPQFILKIYDARGVALEELDYSKDPVMSYSKNEYKDEEVLSPQTAYIMNYLLKEVIRRGTGAKIGREIEVPIAGKTGTSNDFIDAWFVGYTPSVATGVWVGFDENVKTLGYGESGASAAIPIWLTYMKDVVKMSSKNDDFIQPSGIKLLKIDRSTGKIASKFSKSYSYLPFKEGTEPKEVEGFVDTETADEVDFFREDY